MFKNYLKVSLVIFLFLKNIAKVVMRHLTSYGKVYFGVFLLFVTYNYIGYYFYDGGTYFYTHSWHLNKDIDFDGENETILIDSFNHLGGNSGFNLLIVMSKDKEVLGCYKLGEWRGKIERLSVRDNEITVTMLAHSKQDAMCCPTEKVQFTFFYDYYYKVLRYEDNLSLEEKNNLFVLPERWAYPMAENPDFSNLKTYFKPLNSWFKEWQENKYDEAFEKYRSFFDAD